MWVRLPPPACPFGCAHVRRGAKGSILQVPGRAAPRLFYGEQREVYSSGSADDGRGLLVAPALA